jgi:hypothetical protein
VRRCSSHDAGDAQEGRGARAGVRAWVYTRVGTRVPIMQREAAVHVRAMCQPALRRRRRHVHIMSAHDGERVHTMPRRPASDMRDVPSARKSAWRSCRAQCSAGCWRGLRASGETCKTRGRDEASSRAIERCGTATRNTNTRGRDWETSQSEEATRVRAQGPGAMAAAAG